MLWNAPPGDLGSCILRGLLSSFGLGCLATSSYDSVLRGDILFLKATFDNRYFTQLEENWYVKNYKRTIPLPNFLPSPPLFFKLSDTCRKPTYRVKNLFWTHTHIYRNVYSKHFMVFPFCKFL